MPLAGLEVKLGSSQRAKASLCPASQLPRVSFLGHLLLPPPNLLPNSLSHLVRSHHHQVCRTHSLSTHSHSSPSSGVPSLRDSSFCLNLSVSASSNLNLAFFSLSLLLHIRSLSTNSHSHHPTSPIIHPLPSAVPSYAQSPSSFYSTASRKSWPLRPTLCTFRHPCDRPFVYTSLIVQPPYTHTVSINHTREADIADRRYHTHHILDSMAIITYLLPAVALASTALGE